MSQLAESLVYSTNKISDEDNHKWQNRVIDFKKNVLNIVTDSDDHEKINSIEYKTQILNDIIQRIRNTRPEYRNDGVNYAAIALKKQELNIVCHKCRNNNVNNMQRVKSSGDTICLGADRKGCGEILIDHAMDQGNYTRNFEEDDSDKRYFGAKLDPLMSDSYNMRTKLVYEGTKRLDPELKRIMNARDKVEMNVSTINHDDHRTREEYKNKQKQQAFAQIQNIGANLLISDAIQRRAMEEFKKFRDVRELLHQYEGVVAACLSIAFEENLLQFNHDGAYNNAFDNIIEPIVSKPLLLIGGNKSINEIFGLKYDPNDKAITTFTDVPLGKWTAEQVQDWLHAVSSHKENNRVLIKYINDELDKKNDSNSSKKRKLEPTTSSIFGVTTTAGRQKNAIKSLSIDGANVTAGQILGQLNFYIALGGGESGCKGPASVDLAVVNSYKDARNRRINYDLKVKEVSEYKEHETRRLATEKDTDWSSGAKIEKTLEETVASTSIMSGVDIDDAFSLLPVNSVVIKQEPTAEKPKIAEVSKLKRPKISFD